MNGFVWPARMIGSLHVGRVHSRSWPSAMWRTMAARYVMDGVRHGFVGQADYEAVLDRVRHGAVVPGWLEADMASGRLVVR